MALALTAPALAYAGTFRVTGTTPPVAHHTPSPSFVIVGLPPPPTPTPTPTPPPTPPATLIHTRGRAPALPAPAAPGSGIATPTSIRIRLAAPVAPPPPPPPGRWEVLAAPPSPAPSRGWGKAVPLSLALQQIVPPGWQVLWRGGNPLQPVTWKGGAPWPAVLSDVVVQAGVGGVLDARTRTLTILAPWQPMPPPEEIWHLRPEDTLRENVIRWAHRAGWNRVLWEASDYPVYAMVRLHGAFASRTEGPLAAVVRTYADTAHPLAFHLSMADRVIRVTNATATLHSVPPGDLEASDTPSAALPAPRRAAVNLSAPAAEPTPANAIDLTPPAPHAAAPKPRPASSTSPPQEKSA